MNHPNVYRGLIALLILPLGGMGKVDLPQKDQAEIQRLIRQLGSESFQEREAASRDLAAIGEPARNALRRAMLDPDPEIRRRADRLVEDLDVGNTAREVAALQGLWVLKTTECLGVKADQDPTEDELEKLWRRQRNPAEERELVEDASQRRTTLAFKGGTFERREWLFPWCGGNGFVTSFEGTFHLDVDRTPKVMERRREEDGIRTETHVTYCIYSVREDTLLMCVNLNGDPGRLPTQFATAEDEDVVLLTFKREKK